MAERLVIINRSPEAAGILAEVGALVHIVQKLPPRLAIVEGDEEQLDAVGRLAGVLAVCASAVPERVLEDLDEGDLIFAQAWSMGRKPKTARPGDGLPWDAEGFEPPDRFD